MRVGLFLGTLGAVAGALIGAAAWAAITASTNFQIGYMAVGVGLLAGYGMRVFGGGRDKADGIVAAVVALGGCIVGNLLTAVVVISRHDHYSIPVIVTALAIKPAFALELLRDGFDAMDLLFYGIAVVAGYRTAMRPHGEPIQPATAPEPPAAV